MPYRLLCFYLFVVYKYINILFSFICNGKEYGTINYRGPPLPYSPGPSYGLLPMPRRTTHGQQACAWTTSHLRACMCVQADPSQESKQLRESGLHEQPGLQPLSRATTGAATATTGAATECCKINTLYIFSQPYMHRGPGFGASSPAVGSGGAFTCECCWLEVCTSE